MKSLPSEPPSGLRPEAREASSSPWLTILLGSMLYLALSWFTSATPAACCSGVIGSGFLPAGAPPMNETPIAFSLFSPVAALPWMWLVRTLSGAV